MGAAAMLQTIQMKQVVLDPAIEAGVKGTTQPALLELGAVGCLVQGVGPSGSSFEERSRSARASLSRHSSSEISGPGDGGGQQGTAEGSRCRLSRSGPARGWCAP